MGLTEDLKFDEDKFVSLLEKLIGETKHLQNSAPYLVPKEDRAGQHVLDVLRPHSREEGGPLAIQHVSFVEGRGNLIVEYPGTGQGVVGLVGCHLDVVSADPATWASDPFTLTRDGDKLMGRGTTDCLGHVALVADIMRQLAVARPPLRRGVIAVFIANEENSTDLGVGVDELVRQGYLDRLKGGPLYWIDTADSKPCIGTAGIAAWELQAKGRLFHSGMPQLAINPIELAMDALAHMQRRFYAEFTPHPQEARYAFQCPSTLKPTQVRYPGGSVNQIPGECTICGDCRITPFYDAKVVMDRLQEYIAEFNASIDTQHRPEVRGPAAKYVLANPAMRGKVILKFNEAWQSGLACRLDSDGYRVMVEAFQKVTGKCEPYSITGALPCIKEL